MPLQWLPVQEKGDIPEELLPPSGFIERLRDFIAPERKGVGGSFKVNGKAIVKIMDGLLAMILEGITDLDDRIRNPWLKSQLLMNNPNVGNLSGRPDLHLPMKRPAKSLGEGG